MPSMTSLRAKFLLAAVLLAALYYGVRLHNQSIRDAQRALDVAEYDAKLIAAQEAARAQENAWRAKQSEDREKTNELLNARDVSYVAIARDAARLRKSAANYSNGLPSDTLTASRAGASALANLFGQCAEALREMGKAADGQYIDSMSCRSSWPN